MKKQPKDISEIGFRIVEQATSQEFKPETLSKVQISQFMAHLGKKGGLKGGKARAASLSSGQRKEIAQKAAQARWKNKNK